MTDTSTSKRKDHHILVTGGTGYIGSHTVVELINKGYKVSIIDNLSNSKIEVLDRIESITNTKPEFKKLDLLDRKGLLDFFKSNAFDGVIHFAAHKSVRESVHKPVKYYKNNLTGLINILEAMVEHNVNNIVFSSSCTVYGNPKRLPVTENTPIGDIASPYGGTKKRCEDLLKDLCHFNRKLKSVVLRYFNPIGSHPSGLIGEDPSGIPDNLVPYICQTATGERDILNVYGNDYDTPDGTPIRDYIHVSDLAEAHIKSIDYLGSTDDSVSIFNIGTGRGYSVLEVIKNFEMVNNLKIQYKIAARREGDIMEIWADNRKAVELLDWHPKRDLSKMTQTAWKWQLNSIKSGSI